MAFPALPLGEPRAGSLRQKRKTASRQFPTGAARRRRSGGGNVIRPSLGLRQPAKRRPAKPSINITQVHGSGVAMALNDAAEDSEGGS
jgi:hypothetical protein